MGRIYWSVIALVGLGFAAAFAVICVPPFLQNPDLVGAFCAGFVNRYAAGFSLDAIACWVILTTWIVHERATLNVKHGWIAIVLGAVPGVATGFALYLFLRARKRVAA